MQIKLGDRIKSFRKRDGRKQEDLATALGVTNQAVSKWESNKGYPDMEMIPSIANYFHVTIDELFGYDNDRSVRLAECLRMADTLNKPGVKPTEKSIEKLEKFLRDALDEFPNEWQLQFRLSVALQIKSSFVCKNQNIKEKSLREAAALLKQAQKNTDDPHWKDSISHTLAGIYYQLGDDEQIEIIASENSPAYVCRELILTKTSDSNKAAEYYEEAMLSLLHEMTNLAVGCRVDKGDSLFFDSQVLYLSLIKIFKDVLKDGPYGFFHSDMCFLHLRASRLSAREGKEKECIRHFDEAFRHYSGFKMAWEDKTLNPNPDGLKNITDYPGLIMYVDETVLREHLNTMPKKIADQIRRVPKYRTVL